VTGHGFKISQSCIQKVHKKSWLKEFPKLIVPNLHKIRATKAIHMYKGCRSELIVQRYLGHEDIRPHSYT